MTNRAILLFFFSPVAEQKAKPPTHPPSSERKSQIYSVPSSLSAALLCGCDFFRFLVRETATNSSFLP
ncbi:hypothetical protein SLEP1_g18698 [Rubroshorea leprosula]|uniref:Secreted protein n=1 Tax=Rubroshorea leprosula TaxID=152421 RepID=A0AAV5JA90_9ROSI|nr:hypothetical protein SLEP1_g18698 [Rubroshorea leprosula]